MRAEDALERLIAHIHATHPGVPVILDAKRGDIGSTAAFYAAEAFDRYGADAVTVNPYLGRDSLEPFLARADKGVVILCRTSNRRRARPAGSRCRRQRKLYQHVARTVAREWNANGNCLLVVGATYPGELADVRAIVGDMPLLVPGIGAQGGDVEAVVRNGATEGRHGAHHQLVARDPLRRQRRRLRRRCAIRDAALRRIDQPSSLKRVKPDLCDALSKIANALILHKI